MWFSDNLDIGNEQEKFLQIMTVVWFEKSFPSKNGYFDRDCNVFSVFIGMINPSGKNFLYSEFTISEFSVLIMVISVGELRYKFITLSKYPNANGFSAAEVAFDSRIFFEISKNFSWFLRISNDFCWFSLIPCHFWWFLKVSCDFGRIFMILYDFLWLRNSFK